MLYPHPETAELSATRELAHALRMLAQTEKALQLACEDLVQERLRTARAVRCMQEYKRLYELARSNDAAASPLALHAPRLLTATSAMEQGPPKVFLVPAQEPQVEPKKRA